MEYQDLIDNVGLLISRVQERALELLPRLIGALAIFLVGWILALLLRFAARRLVMGLDRLVPSHRVQKSLRRLGMEKPASDVIGGILYWIVLIFFLTAATETLGLPVVTTWLSGVALYLPRILSAALICFAGLIGGFLLRDLVASAASSAGLAFASALGHLAQIAALLVSILIAVDQVGINIDFLTSAIIASLAMIFFGGALAFGLGARTTVSNILASYYLQKSYSVGHVVRVGDQQGEIVEITPTAVILKSAEGRVLVPAKIFSEMISVLLTGEG
jgi:small-conductance mechanosensitive channel